LTSIAGFVLAVAGIAICTYLVSEHYADRTLACGPVGDCQYVQDSKYSTLAGLPIALLGLGLYVLIALAMASTLVRGWSDNAAVVAFSLTLAGVLYSAYLTYLELFVLDAVCIWCLASAANLVLLFGLALLALQTVTSSDPGRSDDANSRTLPFAARRANRPSR
jgi:uncharacterized membrane protein